MTTLKNEDPEVWQAIQKESERQQNTIDLIASENICSLAVQEAQGSSMTNKYAEGYSGRRWYAGCANVDAVEILAIERAKKIFGAEHVNVQPNAGSQANMAVCFSVLKPGDRILGMDLSHGGHLTHGFKKNFSGMMYQITHYGVKKETGFIDYDEVRAIALKTKPHLIIAGASAYPRILDFPQFRKIADEVGAYFMADIAHIAGLVAGGVHPSPVPYADFVTTTTHKTLRGPRGGMILCKQKYAKQIDSMVFPGIQGGPFMHIIAAKAVAFKEAMTNEFKQCQKQTVENAKVMAQEFVKRGYAVVSGGTDNHLFLIDLRNKNITGKEAQVLLETVDIILNRNTIPFDEKGASANEPNGIRIGTPTVASRGMKEAEVVRIADCIDKVLSQPNDNRIKDAVRKTVRELCSAHPL
ncbi:MAG: serine hydroxymethyltransferase [Planctomycetia bacterium]|uniref:Serine hydroxymethyltransferase n=1 Tax=Candidatus Brocadia sapporoensis TaxID=392547 RepID=A0A1V6M068_9BACT|nr:serine hydroxymethyltransferase [Candidatus Brocadia sapporoensis]MCC7238373.1 serine hydroxymethyltransferase [Candidatus Brocadia sp.]QOJ05329.1 MAG: serine hydroxymethyltransferase [Planctomycetia bacterium]TVL97593.1 MAG: serine hydroxymethyltransferase [Candidatus Brocadia sp. BL1]MDG6006052.1 serine hydroxymethyltransferase [Candidatus Brocadia sp.]OQD45757.1 serine hydroxymethyltransferase [Candidatus Brocadia sapporoensis]